MNSVVRQLWEQGTDVVMVDTGNSYEGLCEYVGGKYISYTEEHPITMNPFRIQREELNVEKTDFLKNLIMLICKIKGTVLLVCCLFCCMIFDALQRLLHSLFL